jgi:hypothetical protein
VVRTSSRFRTPYHFEASSKLKHPFHKGTRRGRRIGTPQWLIGRLSGGGSLSILAKALKSITDVLLAAKTGGYRYRSTTRGRNPHTHGHQVPLRVRERPQRTDTERGFPERILRESAVKGIRRLRRNGIWRSDGEPPIATDRAWITFTLLAISIDERCAIH